MAGARGWSVTTSQIAVDTKHHPIVAHEVTNVGHDRDQLTNMAKQAKDAVAELNVVADRGYFGSQETLGCQQAGIAPLPKPATSGAKANGRLGRGHFVYHPGQNEYSCPAGERLKWRFSRIEGNLSMHRYLGLSLPAMRTQGKVYARQATESDPLGTHEDVLEAMQKRLGLVPESMRIRRETVGHPFGTLKSWMGYTHFLTKTLDRVSTEMSLHVLAYNLKRVINIMGMPALMGVMVAT